MRRRRRRTVQVNRVQHTVCGQFPGVTRSILHSSQQIEISEILDLVQSFSKFRIQSKVSLNVYVCVLYGGISSRKEINQGCQESFSKH